MKKTLVLVMAVMATSMMNAQEFKFGAKVGLNVATLTGAGSDSKATPAIGFHLGGFTEIKLTDQFALQPELLFSMQGAKGTVERTQSEESLGTVYTTRASGSENTRINYLTVPIMAKYFVVEKLSIEAGPQLSFLLSGNSKTELTVVTTPDNAFFPSSSTSSDTNIKDSVKSIDFGFNLGAGYELENGLLFQVRYNLGLTKINKEGNDAVKNRVFQVSVGYMF